VVREKARRTRGESSASTERAREAVLARWEEGKGMWRVLWCVSEVSKEREEGCRYRVQGKSSCFQSFWSAMVLMLLLGCSWCWFLARSVRGWKQMRNCVEIPRIRLFSMDSGTICAEDTSPIFAMRLKSQNVGEG
jgi:hypothetical protein